MTAYSLLICIVPHDSGEFITGIATAAGAGGGTIVMGRGTASHGILRVLGLGDLSKDIVYVIVPFEKKQDIVTAVIAASESKQKHFGILFSVDISEFAKCGIINGGADSMAILKDHKMITVIVNRGYAEDVMDAARKAGAGGGTILNARGTAKEEDGKFFGMQIAPEKEMLIILAETENADSIVTAICSLKCLSEPGSGIVFSTEVDDFTQLGRKDE